RSASSLACETYLLNRMRNSVGRVGPSYPWMYTFRLSKGRTSSGLTFWLIPAMRRKDRSGPGIVNCDDAERVPSSGREVTAASESLELAGGCSPVRANKTQLLRENATTRHRQRGDFTVGSLMGAGETVTQAGTSSGRQGVS